MSAKLTVLIPCKNELANIRECIASVRPVADEILVGDSGSTDGTLEAVRKMPDCRIIEREYIHSASFKNWAIPQARHSWVMVVDADERVTPELGAEIRSILETAADDVDGYFINRKNYFLGYHIAHGGWNSDFVLRLFRRDVARYHNRWVHAGVDLPPSRVRYLKNHLKHFTATDSQQYWSKLNIYATWGALNYRDQGRRASILSLLTQPMLRFFQLYLLRRGFLDGIAGLHVCAYTAFYTFLKHARLWELNQAEQRTKGESQEPADAPHLIKFPVKERESAQKLRAA